MKFNTISEISKKWGLSERRIQFLASEGRIEGAAKKSGVWLIPESAINPSKQNKKNISSDIKNRRKLKSIINTFSKLTENSCSDSELRTYFLTSLNCLLLKNIIMFEEDELKKICETCLEKMIRINSIDTECFAKTFEYIETSLTKSLIDRPINLLSWSYQYLNEYFSDDTSLSKTQFFTEQYMIDYLVNHIDIENLKSSIIDPCCGGGNMLVSVLENRFNLDDSCKDIDSINKHLENVVGIDIDKDLAFIATLNLRIACIKELSKHVNTLDHDLWQSIKPNIYYTTNGSITGSLSNEINLYNTISDETIKIRGLYNSFDVVITNPPFATKKGMNESLSKFLNENFPLSNSDVCVAFIEKASDFLTKNGVSLMVVQNAWMFLKTFAEFRKKFLNEHYVEDIVDLGSGAFFDLSGEKSNVALLKFHNFRNSNNNYISFKNLKKLNISRKAHALNNSNISNIKIKQDIILSNEKYRFDFLNFGTFKDFYYSGLKVSDFAVPMQGTSTGNNKELVGYFWEHFNDSEWILVSKGGGYSKWQGLNRYVVKWGEDAEYIKNQKGHALRNVKHFDNTELVFSDTGTSGLNVRLLLESQIFIASGPGIRMIKGNHFAMLAYLNSLLASYFMRALSPKLTIAAGYIGGLPITEDIVNSEYLTTLSKICIESKKIVLSNRPNNFEYNDSLLSVLPKNLNEAAKYIVNIEIDAELRRLNAEQSIDEYINSAAEISKENIGHMYDEIGFPAYTLKKNKIINLEEVDKKWDKCTDLVGAIKKVRLNKHEIGVDGPLEFISMQLETNPFSVSSYIKKDLDKFELILSKYKNLILHNLILSHFKYSVSKGLEVSKTHIEELVEYLTMYFEQDEDFIKNWIRNSFNVIHNEIFMGSPVLEVKDKVICEVKHE
ncbi:Eco57I restriction-modification methylase domain-containing protein [Facklamia miroungae]|uniref:site-specific DNA-methyltransferase (adenine-specific) n=1 Tax=Facklamia miroungae TaxID=120956 RepID=A0A1G7RDL0_9LACT|nr:N-6 DNA methylase [Facklamia miroungae]NKZ29452.1 N-6 DNA methylase [Facklamia miroungae]SDG08861.1 Type I restriction-modification system, DNA methylase subunit [Facklamia miroungae]